MGVTTVKLQIRTKSALEGLKGEGETYDEVISRLLAQSRNNALKSKLVAAYKSLGKDDLEVLEEWEAASDEVEA